MPILLPFIGIAAVAGLLTAGCDSKKEPKKADSTSEDDPPFVHSSKPESCPAGWSPLELKGEEAALLCHRDSPRTHDGIYQKESDQLSLRVGDRFISAQDAQFPQELERLQIPNLEGIRLPFWAKSPRERFQALQLASLLKEVQAENSGFYTTGLSGLEGENKDFIDTAARLMDGGKLKIKNSTAENERAFYLYDSSSNTINIEGDIDLKDLEHRTGVIHELFHFYQDSKKRELSATEAELQAYLKGAEFLMAAYETGMKKGTWKDLSGFYLSVFQKSHAAMAYSPYEKALSAVAFLRQGNAARSQEYTDKLKTAINIHHFLLDIYNNVFSGDELRKTIMEISSLKKSQSKEAFLNALARETAHHQSSKNNKLQALKAFLKTAPDFPTVYFVNRMKSQVTEIVISWVSFIVLTNWKEEATKDPSSETTDGNGTSFSFIDVNVTDPLVAEMLETLGGLDPYGYYLSQMNGVD